MMGMSAASRRVASLADGEAGAVPPAVSPPLLVIAGLAIVAVALAALFGPGAAGQATSTGSSPVPISASAQSD